MMGESVNIDRPRCLFATTRGEGTPTGPCKNSDPMHFGQNADIRKLLDAIGVDSGTIVFRGCPGDKYEVKFATGNSYQINYPPEATDGFIAPIAHELSHIVQIRAAGGTDQLYKRYRARRIELGADYLAGVLFRRIFPGISGNVFQNHVKLKGLYLETPEKAHGTPSQRTAAFRFGVVGWHEPAGITLAAASERFQEDLYAQIVEHD